VSIVPDIVGGGDGVDDGHLHAGRAGIYMRAKALALTSPRPAHAHSA